MYLPIEGVAECKVGGIEAELKQGGDLSWVGYNYWTDWTSLVRKNGGPIFGPIEGKYLCQHGFEC